MNSKKTETWFFPYARPTATNDVLNEDEFFNESMSPLFNNVRHPYNPQYKHNNIEGGANHNMLQGQPEYEVANFYSKYTNENGNQNLQELGLLGSSRQDKANIFWNNNGLVTNKKVDFNPYQINPEFRSLPDGAKNFNNPHKMSGNLTKIVPWDIFGFNKNNDEYLNERNFQEVFNHPFYQNMKPVLEQPFKNL